MISINLARNDIVLKILRKSTSPAEFKICGGRYKGRFYQRALIAEDSVILEGDDLIQLASDASAVYVQISDIAERIAHLSGNESVIVHGARAVPQGEERRILEQLLG